MGQRKLNNETLNCKKYFENEDENNFLPLLRLKGGGESSLSNGTSAWGTPTSQPSNSSNGKLIKNIYEKAKFRMHKVHVMLLFYRLNY